jgi:hypothetical protein
MSPALGVGEGKTMYTFSVSVNAFSVEFPLACYQQVVRVWYISGALQRTYMLFYPAPIRCKYCHYKYCHSVLSNIADS